MDFSLRPYGERGILLGGLDEVERTHLIRLVQKERPPACLEYVTGFDSILFLFREPVSPEDVEHWLGARLTGKSEVVRPVPIKKVPVVYDGPDLETVSRKVGLSVDEVVAVHSQPIYTVRMMGFAPGFPYLDGLDARLQIPRKDVPLKRIEPGAVAIGGPHAGIYSVASPGGWHLLGQTSLKLFNPDAARGECPQAKDVFFFAPGDRVQFYAAD